MPPLTKETEMINFTPSEIDALTKKQEFAPLREGVHDVIIQSAKEGVSRDNTRKLISLSFKNNEGRLIFSNVFTDSEELKIKLAAQIDEEPTEDQAKRLEMLTRDSKKLKDLISSTGIVEQVIAKGGLDLDDLVGKSLSLYTKNSSFNGKTFTNVLAYQKKKSHPKLNSAIEQ